MNEDISYTEARTHGAGVKSQLCASLPVGEISLVVEFLLRNDRYQRTVSVIDGLGQNRRLLESIEGESGDDWPESPPLQSLHVEDRPDGRQVALLVGMAGRSHWSASIEPAIDRAELVFDIACRHSAMPAWLGSQYRRINSSRSAVRIRPLDCRIAEAGDIVTIEPLSIAASAATTRFLFVGNCLLFVSASLCLSR